MLNCHDATVLMSQRQERSLFFSERLQLRLHVTMCRGCANFERQLPELGTGARSFANQDDGKPS